MLKCNAKHLEPKVWWRNGSPKSLNWYSMINLINPMQLYFLCLGVFQSSSFASSDELARWWLLKTNFSVLQISFCVKSLLTSNLCTVIFVLWMVLIRPLNALACRCPCWCHNCVYGLRRPKILEFFEMHICLALGAQMFFRHKWRK